MGGCTNNIAVPMEFVYKEIKTDYFTLASWQKINKPNAVYKVYIEGDGYAFNAAGRPTQNPTPRSSLMRELAFGDKSPNVVYLARPCQFVQDEKCKQKYWSTARFASKVIAAEHQAIKNFAGKQPVILVGYSGGAQIAGLLAVKYNDLEVKKLITIAGNLDHRKWCEYHQVPHLDNSLYLGDYKQKFKNINQLHYVGTRDDNILPEITMEFVENTDTITQIERATHGRGWERIFPLIWQEN